MSRYDERLDQFVTAKEAAEYLGISVRTVYRIFSEIKAEIRKNKKVRVIHITIRMILNYQGIQPNDD